MSNILVTGGAGFIGSYLIDRLINVGDYVTVLDNFAQGRMENIKRYAGKPNFRLVRKDLLSHDVGMHLDGVDRVYHLAAGSNVRIDPRNPDSHLSQNVMATKNLLEAMERRGVGEMVFASTSAVYGKAATLPTHEDYGSMEPISMYGKTKLVCEMMISSYCRHHGMGSVIFRLANVIGRNGHGVVPDFVRKLRECSSRLDIFGNGNQTKSYLHIDDCIDAMLMPGIMKGSDPAVYNVGSEDQASVRRIAEIVSEEMGLSPELVFGESEGGWAGDVPVMWLDISRMKGIGWNPRYNSEDAIKETVREILQSA